MSVAKFDNGARPYQIQPHPEMAGPESANFLIRRNPWIAKKEEMGEAYYKNALMIPGNADFSVAKVIPNFVRLAKEHLEATKAVKFIAAAISAKRTITLSISYLINLQDLQGLSLKPGLGAVWLYKNSFWTKNKLV